MVVKKIMILFYFILIIPLLLGCSNETSVYSVSSGNGYKINMMVSSNEISDGGSISIQAFITDPNGNPVPDEDEVVKFACSQDEVKFDDSKCDVKNGFAATTATWEDQSDDDNPDPPRNATITATYKGAINSLQVILITEAF